MARLKISGKGFECRHNSRGKTTQLIVRAKRLRYTLKNGTATEIFEWLTEAYVAEHPMYSVPVEQLRSELLNNMVKHWSYDNDDKSLHYSGATRYNLKAYCFDIVKAWSIQRQFPWKHSGAHWNKTAALAMEQYLYEYLERETEPEDLSWIYGSDA